MRRVRSFIRLPWREKLALAWAGFLLACTRVALRVLPLPTLRRVIARLARTRRHPGAPAAGRSEIERILWAVSAGGRLLPAPGRCLTQALVGYVLLARRGYTTDLRIGVTRDEGGRFVAHAWLERGDAIVLGQLGPEHKRYTPFPALRGLEPSSWGPKSA
jgi:hypothetical protein